MPFILYKISQLALVSTEQLTIVLLLTAGVFLIFIALAIIKMYKLKAENKRLSDSEAFKAQVDESYKDFTDGHLYDNK